MLVTNVVANEYIIGLYRIDLDKNNLTMIYSEKDVGMYNSMTVVGDKLFITKLLNSGGCDLEEYNTKTNERKNICHFDYDNNINTGTVMRQITADENTISFLLLKLEMGKNVHFYTNIYDYDMNLLETVELDVVSRDRTELQQPVACFYIANDFIYYENFSTTRFFGKINENISESIMEQNGNFSMIAELYKNRNEWVVYESFTNDVYLINTLDGEVNKTEYYSNDDERYYITYMLRAGNDNILITMDYQDPNTGDKLPKKIYYLNLSDLEFQH